MNALGKIFDKKTIQEQQELANLFGELAFKEVHKISKANGWDEGSPQKIALHAFVGAVMADLGGGNALSGAVGAGLNEAVQKELKEKFERMLVDLTRLFILMTSLTWKAVLSVKILKTS